MRKLYKQTFLALAAGIGLGFAAITASFNLAAQAPATAKTQKISDSSQLFAQTTRTINKDEILAAHNKYRQEVGVPALKWSDTVATAAQKWAEQLASTGQFKHSGSASYGENLWMGTAGAFSFTQMVESWGNEKKFFVAGTFPNVSSSGNWQDVGHYTQVIWRNTTEVGCALATGGGNDYLVCQYNPKGNYIGQKVY
ncbi:CAP domain-containing protein [Kamptonema formosum]|uniref:CAP domain-containing protein n=1 Tax=Kamptonema formosum TaxID=331992 RepID=UPI000347FB9C|nr:CAP domain-containing protein [Oscillatoria sp. PCC 10802]